LEAIRMPQQAMSVQVRRAPRRAHLFALLAFGTVLALAISGSGSAAAGSGSGANGGSNDGNSTPQEWSPSRTRIVTYNTSFDVPPRGVRSDLRHLAQTGVGIIALQEMGGRNRRAAARDALVDCASCHYSTTMPTGGKGANTPIFWRNDRFVLRRAGVQKLTDKTYVGPRGAGPATVPPKYATWVLLRELKSGRKMYVLSTHPVASVQGKNGGANPRMTKRVQLYTKHLHALNAFVDRLRATGRNVVVCGDFNVNYRRDRVVRDRHFPYVNMPRSGLQPSYDVLGEPGRGTHTLRNGLDTRLIDYVYYGQGRALTFQRQNVKTGFRSDHRPLVVRLAIAART
jgi:endonuclease/exonuclease/phosphatase family metal-dependent hydrolase